MGVGGMVGGGIFSVLGLAMAHSGHAAPLAFLLGGGIALLTGWSYARLGLRYRSDGGSFTYLEQAFGHGHLAAIGGWLLLAGYVGTLALYGYTFGSYGAAMLGDDGDPVMRRFLSSFVLLAFLSINLYGVKETGLTELLIVTAKVLILGLFAAFGLVYLDPDRLHPLFDKGWLGVPLAAALIFVAYEGFELIPNAVNEMQRPERNLVRGILLSIGITMAIYVSVSLVAVGFLTEEQIRREGEYALAVAARPFLGEAGFLLIGLAALFSTASAINATLFGTARLGMEMATSRRLPAVFAFRRRRNGIPWASLLIITAVTLAFVTLADLTMISAFASSTFLLIFAAINGTAFLLRREIAIRPALPLLGAVLALAAWITLMRELFAQTHATLYWLLAAYAAVAAGEFLFSQRGFLARRR